MSHTVSPAYEPQRRMSVLDTLGAVVLTATLVVALAFSSAEWAKVVGANGPDAVSTAFGYDPANV